MTSSYLMTGSFWPSVQSEFEAMTQSLRDKLRDWTSASGSAFGSSNLKDRGRDDVDSASKEDFATRVKTVQLHLNLPVRPMLVGSGQDFQQARRVLRAAYAEDQVFKWLLGDLRKDPQAAQKSAALLEWLTDWKISNSFRYSYCLAIPNHPQSDQGSVCNEIRGCAIITCPGYVWTSQVDEVQQFLALINTGNTPPTLLGPQCKARFSAMELMSNARHKYTRSGPHWYIHMLGVEPDLQRQGTGRMLMRIICALADQDALPVHLEVSGSKTRSFFEQCGFRTMDTVDVCSEDSPTLKVALMTRVPFPKSIELSSND